eukprot:5700557-Amphidinium_carterae.1
MSMSAAITSPTQPKIGGHALTPVVPVSVPHISSATTTLQSGMFSMLKAFRPWYLRNPFGTA